MGQVQVGGGNQERSGWPITRPQISLMLGFAFDFIREEGFRFTDKRLYVVVCK